MKLTNKTKFLPLAALILGIAGWLTRMSIYRQALDHKGLLIGSHPLVWVLTALALAAAAAAIFSPREELPLAGSVLFPAAGSFLFAAGLAQAGLELELLRPIDRAFLILAVLGAAGQIWAGFSHLRKKEPFFACTAIPGLFLILFTVVRYSIWSGNPQLHSYLFYAAALILLTLTACCQSSYAVGLGWGKYHLALAMGACFACLTGIPLAEDPLLLAAGGLWALLSLYRSAPQEV